MNKNNVKTNKQIDTRKLDFFLSNNTKELKKITNETVKLYNRQCNILKRHIKALAKLEPKRCYEDAHIKWEQELGTLEDNYNLIFDKYLKEKKELEKVNRINLY